MKKQIGCVVLEVVGCNPNGDPHTDHPRVIKDDIGMITDVCLKRRIVRDVLDDHSSEEFKEYCGDRDPDTLWIFESEYRGFLGMKPSASLASALKLFKDDPVKGCQRYIDIRMFGSTMLDEVGDKHEKLRFIRTGAIQIGMAFSLRPIVTETASGVCANPKNGEFMDKGNSMPCNDSIRFVNHGLYCFAYHITPGMARHTGLNDRDVDLFKDLLKHSFEYGRSANRVGISVVRAIHGTHTNTVGSFNELMFRQLATPTIVGDRMMPSTSLADYGFEGMDKISQCGDGEFEELVAAPK